jgi:methylase of polypeptide subunit release factors
MTLLAAYDRARQDLADANSVEEVLQVRDAMAHAKLYAKQIGDKALLEEALVTQTNAERVLGKILSAFREAGKLAEGRKPKAPDPERVTLDDIGVDRPLSSRAQKLAAMSDDDFKAIEDGVRQKVRTGRAILVDPIDQRGPINGARAIMGSRAEPDDSLDYFPTPPWATRALVEHVFEVLHVDPSRHSAGEPACGEGHIAEVLAEYFAEVSCSDIHPYGYSHKVADFLDQAFEMSVDWIITNPPFGDEGEAFLHKSLELAEDGVALFMRVQWLDTIGRYERVFRDNPPTLIAFFAERVNLCKGRWDPEGSTATAYMWLVWKHGAKPRAPFWIPPGCREGLSKTDDVERFTARPVMKRVKEAA